MGMLKITISGKLNPAKVHKILQGKLDEMLELLRNGFGCLGNAFAKNLIKIEGKVTVVKNSDAIVIFEDDSLQFVYPSLKEATEFYDDVSLTTQEVEETEEPQEDMVLLEEPIAEEMTAEDRERERWLGFSYWELNLSVRARKCINRSGVETIGDLVEKTAQELLAQKNFGPTMLKEVRAKLSERGLKLKGD